jgi:hypothetical protein
MTSVRKKTSSELFRAPRWLRSPPKSLRSIINPEELSIYRRMRKAVIQELRPRTPIEWILVNEFVNAQFSAMRYGTWQAAVMQFSVGEGLRRAVKNRLRSGTRAAKRISIGGHKNWRVACVPMSTITPLKLRCTCLDEARWTAFIKDNSVLNVAGIHRCANWSRGEAVSKRRPRKSGELSLTSGTTRNLRLLKWRPSQEKMARVTLLN